MKKFITDERTGLRYELVEDYYLIAGEDELESKPIGVWGQRHLRYLKQYHRVRYYNLLTSGKLNDYLIEKELAWIKTTDRPYLTIEARVNELEKRKNLVFDSVKDLITL